MDFTEEKFLFGLGTALALISSWLVTQWMPGLAPSMSTITGGLTAVYAIFAGGSVSSDWVQSKTVTAGTAAGTAADASAGTVSTQAQLTSVSAPSQEESQGPSIGEQPQGLSQ